MRVGGGRGVKRLLVATALLLFLLPLVPVAPAQAPSDPWWGPTDRAKPTEGWAVRVPVVVENRNDFPLQDAFVAAEIDFTKLLVAAGWTNQTINNEVHLRGFNLDVDSIRVVEYEPGFTNGPKDGATRLPTPHTFYPALFDSEKYVAFHPERNPAGTILFQIDGFFAAHAKRYFYVYANPIEFGKMAPAEFKAIDRAPLDAFMWGTHGTVYLGYQPAQIGQGQTLEVLGLQGPTTVRVYTRQLGAAGFTLLPATASGPNPFILQPFQSRSMKIPAQSYFKIEADRPVVVVGSGDPAGLPYEPYGYVPGASGAFADDLFFVRGFTTGTQGVETLRLIKASPGTVTVGGAGGTVTLTNANPISSIDVPANQWVALFGTGGKFLVSMDHRPEVVGQAPEAYAAHPVPATSGGPSGTEFYTFLENDEGAYSICPERNATVRLVDDTLGGSLAILPDSGVGSQRLVKGEFCHDFKVPRGSDAGHTYLLYSTADERDPVTNAAVPVRLSVGAGSRVPSDSTNLTRPMVGHFAGLGGVDYSVKGDFAILGHYNQTRVTIFEEREHEGKIIVSNSTRAVRRDEVYVHKPHAEATGRYHVVANKPLAVVSLAAAEYKTKFVTGSVTTEVVNPVPYVRYSAGRPLFPDTTIGKAEFRGPLVELRLPGRDARTDYATTGPGSPLAFRLEAVNLGRWVNGESLQDTVSVSCVGPVGWKVEGCAKDFPLSTGSSERLSVVVTPPEDATVNTQYSVLVEARSKAGGVTATFKILVYVQVRYDVEMWFDVEGGRKTIDPPIGLDPGQTYRYNVVVKNTGSTTDTFLVAAEPAREGWEQELTLDGAPVTKVKLDGGASTTLQFRVKAPNLEQAPQNIVSITAQSEANALAADVVNTQTRIRPKVDLELTLDPQTQLAEPEQTVKFNLTTRNKGNDVFTVVFRQDSILPKGWNATLSVQEITLNPNPAGLPELNYVLQVAVTPPAGARAGDLASVKLAAEIDTGGSGRVAGDEVSAVVVVRRVYNLTTPAIFDAEATPGTPLAVTLPVTNGGNGQVTIELLPGAVDPAWPISIERDDITLPLNETAEIPLKILVPAGTPPGQYNLTFTTRLSREALQNLSVPVTVLVLSRAEIHGARSLALTPGRPVSVAYTAVNTGNVEGTFELAADAPPAFGAASFSPARVRLAPGASAPVLLTLNATADAPEAEHRIALQSQAQGQPATTSALNVTIRRPQLTLVNVEGSGALRPGELVLVTATVANGGGIEAENVSVALVVDGRVVDKALLARIPVNSNALATLSWVSTQRGGDVKVVLDPDEEISMVSRDSTAANVEFGSRIGIPGPGLLAIASVLGVAAIAARRRRDGEQR